MKRLAFAIAAATLATTAGAQTLPGMELAAGFHRIEAEVAHTHETRRVGLMNRRSMAPQRGMLFVFDMPGIQCMWMRNTLIPLSVAFIDEQGRILNIEDMAPQTEDNHCSVKPAKYALEMNRSWFAQRGIMAGMAIAGIERAPAAR
jgi:uncharacterized membrane protein (UPF0127 family)